MGTVLSIEKFMESKTAGAEQETLGMPIPAEDAGDSEGMTALDHGSMLEGARFLDYEELCGDVGEYLPAILHHIRNLVVFRKNMGLEGMLKLNFSTDVTAPTMILVSTEGLTEDISRTVAILVALSGRTVRIAVEEEQYYVCLKAVRDR